MLFAKETYSVIFSDEYFEVGRDSELQALVLTYKRQGSSAEFRNLHYKLLESFEKTKRSKLLVDTREMGIVSPDDQRWVGQQMVPQFATHAQNQFLYIAVLHPAKKVFTQLAVNNIEQLSMETESCLNRHFDNPKDARQWLQEQ